jgi:5-methylcytosine-specific restriction endonuclease McrA
MSGAFPQRLQLRREAEQYGRLRFQILERDGWRCQQCGRRDQLQIHHLVRRSQLGADCEENLIALCSSCHRSLHLKGT